MEKINNIYKERFINKSIKDRYKHFKIIKFSFYQLYCLEYNISFHKSFIMIRYSEYEKIYHRHYYISLYNLYEKQKQLYHHVVSYK